MKKTLLGCIIGVFLSSCQQETGYKSEYTLKAAIDDINIKLESRSTNQSNCIQFLISNDTDYLAVLTKKNISVEIYNLDSRKLYNVIIIRKEGPDAFPSTTTGFVMRNLDTLIAVGLAPQQVGIINNSGKVLKRIQYEKDILGRHVNPSFAGLGNRPFVLGDSIFLIPDFNTYGPSGILTSTSQENTHVNVAVNLITGESKVSLLKIPSELIGKDITGIHVWRTLGYKNCFVYSYSIIDCLFVTHDHLSFDEVPIETNYKFKLRKNLSKYTSLGFNEAMQHYLSRDEVINIHYDSYRECYYLVVNKRTDKFEKNIDYRLLGTYPSFFIIILDKKFRHMGDVYFPDNTYCCKMMFISPKGLYISEDHINNPTFSEDYMRFRLFTLEKL